MWRTVKKTTLVRPVRFKVKSVSGQRENSLVPVEATLLRDRTRAAQKLLATGKQGDNRVDCFTEWRVGQVANRTKDKLVL